jgi:hypothetical protein
MAVMAAMDSVPQRLVFQAATAVPAATGVLMAMAVMVVTAVTEQQGLMERME